MVSTHLRIIIPADFLCALSSRVMREPVRLSCEPLVAYESDSLQRYITRKGSKSPCSGQPVVASDIVYDPVLKARIQTEFWDVYYPEGKLAPRLEDLTTLPEEEAVAYDIVAAAAGDGSGSAGPSSVDETTPQVYATYQQISQPLPPNHRNPAHRGGANKRARLTHPSMNIGALEGLPMAVNPVRPVLALPRATWTKGAVAVVPPLSGAATEMAVEAPAVAAAALKKGTSSHSKEVVESPDAVDLVLESLSSRDDSGQSDCDADHTVRSHGSNRQDTLGASYVVSAIVEPSGVDGEAAASGAATAVAEAATTTEAGIGGQEGGAREVSRRGAEGRGVVCGTVTARVAAAAASTEQSAGLATLREVLEQQQLQQGDLTPLKMSLAARCALFPMGLRPRHHGNGWQCQAKQKAFLSVTSTGRLPLLAQVPQQQSPLLQQPEQRSQPLQLPQLSQLSQQPEQAEEQRHVERLPALHKHRQEGEEGEAVNGEGTDVEKLEGGHHHHHLTCGPMVRLRTQPAQPLQAMQQQRQQQQSPEEALSPVIVMPLLPQHLQQPQQQWEHKAELDTSLQCHNVELQDAQKQAAAALGKTIQQPQQQEQPQRLPMPRMPSGELSQAQPQTFPRDETMGRNTEEPAGRTTVDQALGPEMHACLTQAGDQAMQQLLKTPSTRSIVQMTPKEMTVLAAVITSALKNATVAAGPRIHRDVQAPLSTTQPPLLALSGWQSSSRPISPTSTLAVATAPISSVVSASDIGIFSVQDLQLWLDTNTVSAVVLDLGGVSFRCRHLGPLRLFVRVGAHRACTAGVAITICNGSLHDLLGVVVEGGVRVTFQDVIFTTQRYMVAGGTGVCTSEAGPPATGEIPNHHSSSADWSGQQQDWDAVVQVKGSGTKATLRNCRVVVKGSAVRAAASGSAAITSSAASVTAVKNTAYSTSRFGCILAVEGGCVELSGRCHLIKGPCFGLAAVGQGSIALARTSRVEAAGAAGFLAAYGGELTATTCSAVGASAVPNAIKTATGGLVPGVGFASIDGGRVTTQLCVAQHCSFSGFLAAGIKAVLVSNGCCRSERNGWAGFTAMEAATLRAGPDCISIDNIMAGFASYSGAALISGQGCRAINNGSAGWSAMEASWMVTGPKCCAKENHDGGFVASATSIFFAGDGCVADSNGSSGWAAVEGSQMVAGVRCRGSNHRSGRGFIADSGGRLVIGKHSIAEGNGEEGVAAREGAMVVVGSESLAKNNGRGGFTALSGGRLDASEGCCGACDNGQNGFSAENCGSVVIVGPGCVIGGNGGWGVLARGQGAQVQLAQVGWMQESARCIGQLGAGHVVMV